MIECNFKEEYKTSVTQLDYIYTNENWIPIKEINLHDNCYNEGNVIGSAVAKELVIKIDYTEDFDIEEFELHCGTETGLINKGTFIVTEATIVDNANSIEITAYDYMIKSNVNYKSYLDYASNEITILDVLEEVLEQSNLELDSSITSFANSTFVVDSNQFEQGTLCRQVIIAVAQISGFIAKIGVNNKLYLFDMNSKTTADYTLDGRYYNSIDRKRNTWAVNTVILASSVIEGENVTKKADTVTNEKSITIFDNPFAYTQEKRQLLITALYNTLLNFSYTAFETKKQQGLPFLEVGDKIVVKDSEGNSYNSYILRYTYKKKIDSTISAPSLINSEVKYKVIDKELLRWKHTEAKVDKALQEILLTVEKEEVIKNSVNSVIATVEEVKVDLNGLTNTFSSSGGSNLILNSSGQFSSQKWLLENNENGNIKAFTNTETKNTFVAKSAFKLQNEAVHQVIEVVNGNYNLSFKYKKLLELSECKLYINEKEIVLDSLDYEDIETTVEATTNTITIKLASDSVDSCVIGDLMLVFGTVKQVYSINENESITSTVKISDSIEVSSNISETKADFGSDGIRIINSNNNTVTSEFTKEGMNATKITANSANISGLLMQSFGGQVGFS